MQITIDAKTGQTSTSEETGGVVGFCSWRRLAEVFKAAGELKPTEAMVSYRLDDHGIHYRVKAR